jgi:hypothetical protein
MKYAMRAELPGNVFVDFSISTSGELPEAQKQAEGYLVEALKLDKETAVFDWRGQVVFVNQGIQERV